METADIPTTQEDRLSKSHMKSMLVTFFDIKSIAHFEFIPQGQRFKQAYYAEILKR
jgi:hypothetical protein